MPLAGRVTSNELWQADMMMMMMMMMMIIIIIIIIIIIKESTFAFRQSE